MPLTEMTTPGQGGGGGAKVITKFIESWAKGSNETIDYASAGLSQVDYVIAYGARSASNNTFPSLSVWFSDMNSSGGSVQQFYNSGAANIIANQNGNTTAVGSTTQGATYFVNIISDQNGVLTLQNVSSYQNQIGNVTLIVGQFVHETS